LAEHTRIIMDEIKILDYFHELKKEEDPILIWAKIQGGPERKLFFCHVHHCNLVDYEVGILNNIAEEHFAKYCEEGADVFVYSQKDSMLLKSTIKRLHNNLLVFEFPKKINIVADEMKLSIHKTIESLDPKKKQLKELKSIPKKFDEHGVEIETSEDQKRYSMLRAAPRGTAEKGQIAKIQVSRGGQTLGNTTHNVFDISRGGISLLSTKPREIQKDDHITILEINNDPPPFPLEGVVVSIKRIDLTEIKYRIGIKFNQ